MIVTKEYLRNNPDHIFVFGDNTVRKGCGGAAKLRYEPNVYGFITKKFPAHTDSCYYRPEEYLSMYEDEIKKLRFEIVNNRNKTFLISKIGAGLANRFGIFEQVIQGRLVKDLEDLNNVIFLEEI